jgi:hypothetical protein
MGVAHEEERFHEVAKIRGRVVGLDAGPVAEAGRAVAVEQVELGRRAARGEAAEFSVHVLKRRGHAGFPGAVGNVHPHEVEVFRREFFPLGLVEDLRLERVRVSVALDDEEQEDGQLGFRRGCFRGLEVERPLAGLGTLARDGNRGDSRRPLRAGLGDG